MKRIGIFSGTFDPIHRGHIALALQAARSANLDRVYFLPEQSPRRKQGVTHIAHRQSMIRLATAPHPKLEMLDLPDKQFTPLKTTARLNQMFPEQDLVLIVGSDVLEHLPNWPSYEAMLMHMGLAVVVRAHDDTVTTLERVNKLPTVLRELHIIESPFPDLSSRTIREKLLNRESVDGVASSVQRYAKENWLYSSPSI